MAESRRERAVALFMEGYGCAQAVLGAFADAAGLDFDTAMRLASSFGAGMGRMREVCGTCSAMFMIAGLLDGAASPDPHEKARQYALVQRLAARFREKNGTIVCRELLAGLKADTRPTPAARDAEYYRVRPCVRFVGDAAEILEEYLAARGEDSGDI